MSKISSADDEEHGIDCDLEFDAPQWVDLAKEKERSDNDFWNQDSDLHASWFQDVHPLHDFQLKNPTKPGVSTTQKMDTSKTSVYQPKRSSSLTKHSPYSSAKPGRCSNDNMTESPKPRTSSTQTISHSANAPLSPVKTTLKNKAKTTKNPIPQKNVQKTREKENTKSTSTGNEVLTGIDEGLYTSGTTTKEIHNRPIPKKYAEYDENGRRVHKGNPTTCPAPTKTQLNSLTSQARLKSKRRSANDIRPVGSKEAKQKRRSCFPLSSTKESSSKISNQHTTAASQPTVSKNLEMKSKKSVVVPNSFQTTTQKQATQKQNTQKQNTQKQTTQKQATQKQATQKQNTQKQATQKQTDDLTETENEIKELIAQHNSRLAARRAKK